MLQWAMSMSWNNILDNNGASTTAHHFAEAFFFSKCKMPKKYIVLLGVFPN